MAFVGDGVIQTTGLRGQTGGIETGEHNKGSKGFQVHGGSPEKH
jgi:hypothetical protein